MGFVVDILITVFTFVLLLLGMIFFLISRGVSVFKKKNESSQIRQILKLAEKEDGKLTMSQIVMNTNITLKSAKHYMDKLIESELVEIENDEDGTIEYVFYEILQRKKKLSGIAEEKEKQREYNEMLKDIKGDSKYLRFLTRDEDDPGIIDRLFIKVIDRIRKKMNKW